MAGIQTAIQLQDNFTNVLMGIISSVNLTVSQMENMTQVMNADIDTSSIDGAREHLNQAAIAAQELTQAIENTGSGSVQGIRDSVSEQERLNERIRASHAGIERATQGFKGWQKAIIVANQAVDLVRNTLGRLGVTDMSGAFERIDTMNRFQRTVSIMTNDANMANAALAKLKDTTVGTAYGLDVASKATQGFMTRGMGLGAATEQVRIWADAVSFYGKGTNEQLESVVDAIGKMYSKGKVEADQLDRLFDAGIGAAEIYANAVGESVSKVKDQLSDGDISSAQFVQTVSQALDNGVSAGAAKDAGGTWATTFANVGAAITRGWTQVIENLDSALAAHGLPSSMELVTSFGQKAESVLNSVGNAMQGVVGLAVDIGNVMSGIGTFIGDNWGTIAPIISGVIAAMLIYNGALLAYNAIKSLTNAIDAISAARATLHSGATLAEAAATTTATGAQVGFNAALMACPLTWIILLIIALIAVVVALANHFSGAGHVAATAFGAICGGVNVAIQFFKNFGLSVANIALGIANAVKALGSNIMTAFHNAICSVQSWWYGLLATVLSVVEGICEALNTLPFIEFDYSGVSQAADDYAAKSAEAASNKREYKSIGDAFNEGMSTYDTFQEGWIGKAYKSGASWGDGLTSKLKNPFSSNVTKTPKASDYASALANSNNIAAQTAQNTNDTAKSTAKAADSLAISSEDLKYIRDMAEQDYINRFTTASITVNQTNHNTVNNDMDLDGITEHLRTTMEDQMNAAAEGVH